MWPRWVNTGRVEVKKAFTFSDARLRRRGGDIRPSQPVLDVLIDSDGDALTDTLRDQLLQWIVDYNLPGAAVPSVWRTRPKNEKAEAETRQVKAGAAEATDKAIRAIVKAAASFDDDETARDYIVSFDITDQLSDSTIDALVVARHSFGGAAETADPFLVEDDPAFAAARLKKKA